MSFFQRLGKLLSAQGAAPTRKVANVTVQCNRCGEVISAELDLRNGMSEEYDEKTGATSYVIRKVLMGRQRCFQQIEVTLFFDRKRRLTSKQAAGGKFVEAPSTPAAAPHA
jgi:hypothetical protein